jgi:hypothetical protein
MRQFHIALIVYPNDGQIVAVPWLKVPNEPTHSGFINEEQVIMGNYYKRLREYEENLKHAVTCEQAIALKVLSQQFPDRKTLPHIKAHYNVTNISLAKLMGKPERNFTVGETVTCVYALPLPGNEIAPKLELGKEYRLSEGIKDSKGNNHFNVGLGSWHNYIRSYETGEELPWGNQIHWCHPSRFV